jgi:uncharacterized protein
VTPYLLDVNILIAILDPEHVHNIRAQQWFESEGHRHWLTCPTTQNGVIRIMSGPAYSSVDATPARVMESLESLVSVGGHQFVPDAISMLDNAIIVRPHMLATKQVTDSYLLAIAVTNNAMLATLDQRLATDAVRGGGDHILQLP